MSDPKALEVALLRIKEEVAEAAVRVGRRPEEVSIMAVSKFHGIEAVREAYAAGLRLFGESRVQEAEGKFAHLSEDFPGARVELIGHLQSNKAKKAAELFSAVQSVDSPDLLRELDKRARGLGRSLDILLELHTGEESKAGFPDLDSLFSACDLLGELGASSQAGQGLRLRGLMTMAPYTPDKALVRASFRTLRMAFAELARRFPSPSLDTLSMGMSGDFGLAIEEGSTLVRIGTRLFGERTAV